MSRVVVNTLAVVCPFLISFSMTDNSKTEEIDYFSTPQSEWLKIKIRNSPFTWGVLICWVTQAVLFSILWSNETAPDIVKWILTFIIIITIPVYTAYAASLRGRSRLWGLLFIFWLIAVAFLPIKWEKIKKKSVVNFIQILLWTVLIFSILYGTSGYIIWWFVAILSGGILIWYTRKKNL